MASQRKSKSNDKRNRGVFNPTQPQGHLTLAASDGVVVPSTKEPIALKPRNAAQRFYFKAITQTEIPYVVGVGRAGGGKTHGPVIHALNEFRAGRTKKIIITRPMVGAGGEEIGILPGGIVEKVAPWCIPILEIIKEHYTPIQVARMMELEEIEIAPLALMRGRTLKNAIVIADEMQNSTPEQMEMLLTRLGENSRMFITGDPKQHDRGYAKSGLGDFLRRLGLRGFDRHGTPGDKFSVHTFAASDCVRHEAIETVLDMYDVAEDA